MFFKILKQPLIFDNIDKKKHFSSKKVIKVV